MAIPVRRTIDMTLKFINNFRLQHVAGDHSSTDSGTFYYDSTANRPGVRTNSAYKRLAYTDDVPGAGELDAEDINYDPSDADLAATDVKAGLDELSLEKAELDHDHVAADVTDFASAVVAALPSSLATDSEVTTAISTAINNLIDSAPGTLNTLNELAEALGDDPNFATTITNAINLKANKFSANFGNGSATQFTITHNLGTRDLVPSVRLVASPYTVQGAEVDFPTTNTARVTLDSTDVPATDELRLTLVG